jgi:hypothetical protein
MAIKKALLVGINYKGTESELKGCINDILNVKELLVKNCGYKESDIHILTDDTSTKPTKDVIQNELKWLVKGVVSYDTMFLYYSGHGSQVTDNTKDETDGKDEVLVPLDYTTNGVISDDWINTNVVKVVPANANLWIFTDCCHSGTITDLKYTYSSMCKLKTLQLKTNMKYTESDWDNKFGISIEKSGEVVGNVCAISGCQDNQTSTDVSTSTGAHGAFTKCFLESMATYVVNNRYTNNIKLRRLLKDVNCRLDIAGYAQNSQMGVSKQADLEREFVI